MIRHHSIIPFIAFLLVLSLMSCTGSSQKGNNNQLPQLSIGVMSSMDYLPLAVAKEHGLFENEGVEVTINKFYSANERDAAFQSGNLDGTILDYTGAAIQRAGGVNLRLTSQCDGTFVLVANNQSKINRVEDLQSKKLAVSRNTVIDFCTDVVLQQAQITEERVNKIEINKIPLRLEMLRNGKIDATLLPDPFVTIALAGDNKSIIDIKDLDLRVTGLAFQDEAINQKEEALKSFYRAYNDAVQMLESQPVSDFYDLLSAEIGIPADLVSSIQLPSYSLAQLPQTNDLDRVEQWLKAKELVPTDFDINTIVAAGLIP